MSKIVNLDENRRYLKITCEGGVHVLPVSLIEDVIAGKKEANHIERWDALLKVILQEWLVRV